MAAALILALIATAFVYLTWHVKETKEQYLAFEARFYDRFLQTRSLFRDLRVSIVDIGILIILYEGLARLLMKVVPDRRRSLTTHLTNR